MNLSAAHSQCAVGTLWLSLKLGRVQNLTNVIFDPSKFVHLSSDFRSSEIQVAVTQE